MNTVCHRVPLIKDLDNIINSIIARILDIVVSEDKGFSKLYINELKIKVSKKMVSLQKTIQELTIKGVIPEKEIRDVIYYLCEMRGRVEARICTHEEGQYIDSALEELIELIENKKWSDSPLFKKTSSDRARQEEIEKAVSDLVDFMKTTRWWALLGKLGQSKERIQIYSYDDVCDMHEAIYLSGEGFVNANLHHVGDLVEVVEGFMCNVFYGAQTPEWNSSQKRSPNQLIPWLEDLCSSNGL